LATKTVYQTLEDKDNPDHIENQGPFMCKRENAWLGSGFYFWESFIQNAHWWGSECNNYKNGYVICKAFYTEDSSKCFNLIDDEVHLKMFNDTKALLLEKGLYFEGKTTVSRIINYLKDDLKIFKFEATRIFGINSKSYKSQFSNQTIFDSRNPQKYFDSLPAIQICFYSKNSLNLRNYSIVYPDHYIDGYLA